MKKYTCYLFVLLSMNGLCWANSSEEEDLMAFYGGEEMISIATGYSQAISKAPAVASVITANDIKRMAATDVDAVLESIPGLHVARDVVAQNPIYTFRGIYADFNPQVLMLVNGIPITNLFQGDRNLVWGGMPVEAIERIEVIRGPGSAIYGADAFAGVINIVTKSTDSLEGVNVGARYGSFDSKDLWFSLGGESGDFKYSAVVELHKTEGHDEKIDSDAQSVLDAFGTSASHAPGPMSLSKESLDARVQVDYKKLTFRAGAQIRKDIGNGAGAAQALDESNRFGSKRFNVDLTYKSSAFGDNLDYLLQVSYLQTSQEVEEDLFLFPEGAVVPLPFAAPFVFPNGMIGNPEVYETHTRLNLNMDFHGFSNHEIRIGAGYYYGDVYKVEEEKNFGDHPDGLPVFPGTPVFEVTDTPLVFLREDDRENQYVYIQDVWQLGNDWELTAGIRYDDYSDFGDTTNPRAALVWSARHNLTVKALYGEAFRAPSFVQTRAINNPSVLGNPDLDPETIKSYELAFDYQLRHDLNLKANIFQYQWDDIIQFIPDLAGSRTAQNAGEQTGEGVEFEVSWDAADDLTLSGNFAWQKSKDENMDADAANSPEKQLYARADWDFAEDWKLNLQANWVMDRNRVQGDPRSDIDDYVLVDITLRRTNLWKNWEAALLVKNLFDEGAREPSPLSRLPDNTPIAFIPNDLPLAGRSVLGEIRYQF